MTAAVDHVPELELPRRRFTVTPVIELAVLAVAVAIAVGSYFIIAGQDSSQQLLTPPLVALLLVANIVPGVALLMLLGRRVAKRRAMVSPIGGAGRLHVRLVGLFSVVAAVPMLLVTVFASLLFQYGIAFWSSTQAQALLENARTLVQENYQREVNRVDGQTIAMSTDVARDLREIPIDGGQFQQNLFLQTYNRELSEAMIVRRGEADPLAVLNPYGRPMDNVVTEAMMDTIDRGKPVVSLVSDKRVAAVVALDFGKHTYLYASRLVEDDLAAQAKRSDAILHDYRALRSRGRVLQLRFNIALLIISLLIVAAAVLIALRVADLLVRPVGELVDAARRVEGGDLTARVAAPKTQDEVGTLSNAFNQMIGKLQEQTAALVTANDQLDSRRALIEAVMSGVTAGVISIGTDRTIQLMNSSARSLLNTDEETPLGRPLADISPDLAALLDGDVHESIVQVSAHGEPKTLAVKITGDDAGQVLTFDDITEQLLDQRRAAWSDVARRIAHEIKNPLTPIQLAAERLQRRYGKQIDPADGTFARLTDTIVRQVGDLRRMVDEFSSFARMPKPVFREESLVDIGRQALFLHEVAHSNVRFSLAHDDPPPTLVCDRRQIGQALTNIVKNAVEAIEAKGEGTEGEVVMTLTEDDRGQLTVTVADDGVGLPVERDRIVEPYMTTRARGTGLGLAIVKKIVEEHFGTIAFADRDGGGTAVIMTFDTNLLAALDSGGEDLTGSEADERLAALTRNRN